MKFTTTNNCSYRMGQFIPRPWIDCGSSNHEKAIRDHFNKHIRVYDTDNCEFETHDFLFDDGKAFRLEYSYWINHSNEDDELNGFQDEVTVEEIVTEEANVPNRKDRDYIV